MNKPVKLKEVSKVIGSGVTPLRSNPTFWVNGTIPWLKTEQLGEYKIYDTNEKITQSAIDDTSIRVFPINTISIAMYGEGRTRGNVSILKKEMTTNQACCNIVIDESKAHYEYIYYYLKTQYQQLRDLSSGVRKNLNSNDIKEFVIRLPKNIETQLKIASVLSTLDSKIEINKRINEELDAITKTLYDYWFVQFDFPNAEGKPYKTSGGKMVWNEKLNREVPANWEISKIKSKIKIGSGFPFDSSTYLKVGKYKIITIKNVQDLRIETTNVDFIDKIPDNISDFCKLNIGDILMSLTGNVGRICLVPENNLLLNQRVGKILCNSMYKNFAYLFFQREEERLRLEQISTGSSQKNLSPVDAVDNYTFFPPEKILNEFNCIIQPKIQKIILNIQENQKLIQLRDWLLPMLMNGQVKVN